MLLRKLTLRQFRAHAHSELAFAPGINLIHGPNGAGKTNVLEAVHYLCIGRSFVASKDSYALQFGQPFFELRGEFEPERRSQLEIRLVYEAGEGKRVFVNGAPLDRLADLVGRVPVVVFAPGDHALTDGPPEQRRRFLDNTLSQAKPSYLSDLLKYRRTLKQRNAILARGRFADPALLEPWNEELSKSASRITVARARFIDEFNTYMATACAMMKAIAETPTVTYRAFAALPEEPTEDELAELHRARLSEALPREREGRRSLIGPHRDDLIFRLNEVEVRRYASQGQHRTFGMALKLAKFLFLKASRNETPLLLLDDLFSDLYRHQASVFLELLQSSEDLGQRLITTADELPFRDVVDFADSQHSSQFVTGGSVLNSYT